METFAQALIVFADICGVTLLPLWCSLAAGTIRSRWDLPKRIMKIISSLVSSFVRQNSNNVIRNSHYRIKSRRRPGSCVARDERSQQMFCWGKKVFPPTDSPFISHTYNWQEQGEGSLFKVGLRLLPRKWRLNGKISLTTFPAFVIGGKLPNWRAPSWHSGP